MQNTFSQSGNDSKWFLNKSFFKIGMWHSRPPPPFMAKTILNFHFDYWNPSLSCVLCAMATINLKKYLWQSTFFAHTSNDNDDKSIIHNFPGSWLSFFLIIMQMLTWKMSVRCCNTERDLSIFSAA